MSCKTHFFYPILNVSDSIVVSSSSGSATTPAPPSQSPTRRKSYFYEDSGGGGGKGHDRTKDTSVTSPWVSGGGSSERRRVREETDRGRLHQVWSQNNLSKHVLFYLFMLVGWTLPGGFVGIVFFWTFPFRFELFDNRGIYWLFGIKLT